MLIFVEWFINFFITGLDLHRTPLITSNVGQVLGTVIFNYGFVITVPSWVNEKVKNELFFIILSFIPVKIPPIFHYNRLVITLFCLR